MRLIASRSTERGWEVLTLSEAELARYLRQYPLANIQVELL